MEEQTTRGIAVQDVVAVLQRRRRMITTIVCSGLIVAAIAAFVPAPAYEADAKLMVTSDRARMIVSPDAKDTSTVDRVTEQDLNSEVALLRSDWLIRDVLEPQRARVEQVPTGWFQEIGSWVTYPVELLGDIYLRLHGIAAPSRFDRWVEHVAARLQVTAVKGSNLIEVAYEGSDPAWITNLVNGVATQHVERTARLNEQADARAFYEGQRQLLSERLRQAETAIKNFYEREGIDSLPDQRTQMRARLTELENTLAHSKTEAAEGAARVSFLSREIETHPRTVAVGGAVAQNDPMQLLRTRVIELELQRSALLSKFAPGSVSIRQVERQIKEARDLMTDQKKMGGIAGTTLDRTHQFLELNLAQTQAQMAAVKAREDNLSGQITTYRSQLDHLDQIASEQERLQQDVNAAHEALQTYRKKEEAARFSNALDESHFVNVVVVEPAKVPTAPVPSKRVTIFTLGALMSLLVGVGLAFFRDRTDPTIISAADARMVAGIPVLADVRGA